MEKRQILLRLISDIADLALGDGAELALRKCFPVRRPDDLVERFPFQGIAEALFQDGGWDVALSKAG